MPQYQSASAKASYEAAHADWVSADPVDRGDEPQPPPTYSAHLVQDAPEVFEARSGHMVGMIGTYVFESTSEFDDRFVVNANDVANASLWAQV